MTGRFESCHGSKFIIMSSTTLKFTSLRQLSTITAPARLGNGKWIAFITANGHTALTFSYLPESLQFSMKISFAKKVK